MIGKVTGVIDYIADDHILVDVSGIGYLIYVTGATLNRLPVAGQKISLFTELIVREDLLQLVGFISINEREWYKLLTSVQGVGSKAALAVLGHIPIKALSRAILLEDSETIKSAQGIGPKIAKRLVLELKGKVPTMLTLSGKTSTTLRDQQTNDYTLEEEQPIVEENLPMGIEGDEISNLELDAISGLANLGYAQIDASKVVAQILDEFGEKLNVEDLIKMSLKKLGNKR
tara:strand:+ start:425 stop:1114 length:690 start_codon:yes stop_codon:yes gene_type:complete